MMVSLSGSANWNHCLIVLKNLRIGPLWTYLAERHLYLLHRAVMVVASFEDPIPYYLLQFINFWQLEAAATELYMFAVQKTLHVLFDFLEGLLHSIAFLQFL